MTDIELARITRAAQELTAAIDALSDPAPRWAVDPDDPRRITHADSLPDCGKTLTECLQGMEADRLHVAADFEDWHEGYEDALDRLREILYNHGIPVSPTSDATAAPETSATPDAGTDAGEGVSGSQNGAQPDPLDESDHRDRWDREQDPWVRCANGRWHDLPALACPNVTRAQYCQGWSLPEVDDEWGPLTFAPEPDPLDESDHRDRWDRDGGRWIRCSEAKWHYRNPSHAGQSCHHGRSLHWVSAEWGPLTFAPEAGTDTGEGALGPQYLCLPDQLDHSAEWCNWKRIAPHGPDVRCELPLGHIGACSFDQPPPPDPLDEEEG